MIEIKQNTVFDDLIFVHDANGDAVTSLLDAGFTKRISKNGGVFAGMTVTVTERENGWYHVQFSTSHTDTLGLLSITFTHASSKQVNLQYRVTARIKDDLAYPAVSGRSFQVETDGMVHADLKEWLAVAMNPLVSGRVDADAQVVSDKIGYRLSTTGVDDVLDEVAVTFTGKPDTLRKLIWFMRQVASNKFEYIKASDILTLYEDDGSTPKLTHAMTDDATEATRGAS